METLKMVECLAERARRERMPRVPVDCGRVLRTCRQERAQSYSLAWPAMGSALAAALILVFCLWQSERSARASSRDPVAQLFNPVQVELP